jgi:phosphonate transport system substrate-binding protein
VNSHFRATLIFASLFLCILQSPAAPIHNEARAAVRTYSFGIVPQFEQRKLFGIWYPIINEIEKRTGLSFNLVSTLTIADFEKEFARGDFDFVFTNPYHSAIACASQGYLPLVADKTPLRGVVVVRRDSPVRKVSDLDGKIVAFPSPNAIGACLLIRADLEQLFHVTVNPLYVKTHSSVYLHVIKGLAAAGGGVEKTLAEQAPDVRSLLQVIYTTRAFPSHPVMASPRVPERDRERVRRAFLDLAGTAEGKEMLLKVPIKRLVPTATADYLPMLKWGLDKYWVPVGGKD